MINYIILIAKYCIFASTYKMQRPTVEGFRKTLHQRKEAEHYIALAKDKIEQHNQKWGFWETSNKFCLAFCFFFCLIAL